MVERNGQTELTSETERLIDKEHAGNSDGGVGGGRIEEKRKKGERTHGHRPQCGDCRQRGVESGERVYRGEKRY